jgi:hypothetical protein
VSLSERAALIRARLEEAFHPSDLEMKRSAIRDKRGDGSLFGNSNCAANEPFSVEMRLPFYPLLPYHKVHRCADGHFLLSLGILLQHDIHLTGLTHGN